MLPTINHPAVLELEGQADANIQAPAIALRAVVMNADHAAIITLGQTLQRGPEGPTRLPSEPTEVGDHRLAANVVASKRAPPWHMPRGALVKRAR